MRIAVPEAAQERSENSSPEKVNVSRTAGMATSRMRTEPAASLRPTTFALVYVVDSSVAVKVYTLPENYSPVRIERAPRSAQMGMVIVNPTRAQITNYLYVTF